MSILDNKHILTINLDDRSIETKENIRFYNTDRNIANLYVKFKKKNSEEVTIDLNETDLTGLKLKLTVIKPKTKEFREIIGILTKELQEYTCAIYKFELPTEFTDQAGIVYSQFDLTDSLENGENITIDPFSYEVKASRLTGLNAEIIPSPDLPILKQLIEEMKKAQQWISNIDDKNVSEVKTYSNKKIEDIKKNVDEQFISKASKQEVDIERKRITNLATLAQGSTTGDAELIDARVGTDNVIYDNVGNAIRTQFSNIKPYQLIDEYYTECEGNITKTGYITGYDTSTKEIIVPTGGYTDIIKVALKKGDVFKTTIPDSQYVWGKVLTFVDSNNKYVYWIDRNTCTNNSLTFCKYDSNTNIATFDTSDFLNTYNNITHVYIAYKNTKPLIFTTYDISNFKWLTNINYDKKNEVDIIIPSKIHGVVGKELNIYFDNILKNININCINGLKLNKFGESEVLNARAIIVPTSNGIRDLKFTLYRNNLLDLTKLKNIKLNIVNENVGTGTKKILIIGDSKVQGGFISQTLKENIDNDSSTMKCELLGTKYTWSETNKHEGRGGWSVSDYLTKTVAEGNPFYNNGFDFSYYMTQQGYSSVDYVFINLGTNDVAKLSSTGIDSIITNYKTMINSIKSYNGNVKIVIGMCEGVYSLGDTNSTNELKWDMNNSIDSLHEALILNFDNRESEKIYLCAMYLNMDLENDYNFEEVALSSRDTSKKRLKCTDPVHQSSIGYRKCADVMYYTLKYIESLQV